MTCKTECCGAVCKLGSDAADLLLDVERARGLARAFAALADKYDVSFHDADYLAECIESKIGHLVVDAHLAGDA